MNILSYAQKSKRRNKMGYNFSREDCKVCSLILVFVIIVFSLLITVLILDMTYESTFVETSEIKLLPISNDDNDFLFYGTEDKIHYFVQIRNGNMTEKILLPKYLTEVKENSLKPVLKEYISIRTPKNQFYDFLFVNNSPKIQWEICIP